MKAKSHKIISTECVIKIDRDIVLLCVEARFECPSCGNDITILQNTEILKTPTHCSCGRRGAFKQISDTQIDKNTDKCLA